MTFAGSGAVTFVDTNILVYAHDASESLKQPVAAAVVEELWRTGTGVVSAQVLQEFYVVATRRFDPPMSRSEAREIVEAYGSWDPVTTDVLLILSASALEQRHRLSFWDALIVEAALRAGATRIATEDLQAGRRYETVEIINPFI